MSAKKDTQESSEKATGETSKGFTAEEKAAMKERARELKAEARMNKSRAEGEKALFEKIAEAANLISRQTMQNNINSVNSRGSLQVP
jgi:hypothetical protein